MRKPRHNSAGVLKGQVGQGVAKLTQQIGNEVNLRAQPQADVGGNLIVAGPSCMEAFAGIARQLGQAALNVQMNVFQINRPFKLAVLNFGQNGLHSLLDGLEIRLRKNACGAEHVGMSQRAFNIKGCQTLVEVNRRGIAFDEIGDRLGESG